MNAIERQATKPTTLYRRTAFGPVVAQRHQDHCTAKGPGGLHVSVGATSWRDLKGARDRLGQGVDITLNGEVIATARIEGRAGVLGDRQPILLEGTGNVPVPPGTAIEKHGMSGAPRLTASGVVLIRHPFPGWLTWGSRLVVDPTVSTELVVVFAAVSFGLNQALGA